VAVNQLADPVIGHVDSTGNVQPPGAAGSHLHFGEFDTTYNDYVDPEPYLVGSQDSYRPSGIVLGDREAVARGAARARFQIFT
jgi:hypothetical protein